MAETCCELTWLLRILSDLGVTGLTPVQMFCDNRSALHLAKNPVFHERTKHIEVDCHFVRNKLTSGEIAVNYVHTKLQLADMLTKVVSQEQYHKLLDKLGVKNLYELPT
ncbi:hypothetical protein Ancab_039714 [Ancistrocladus abbreviatus]